MSRSDCTKCKYFYVTWDQTAPRGCKYFEIKSMQYPNVIVAKSTAEGTCLAFEQKVLKNQTTEEKARIPKDYFERSGN